MSDTLVPGDVFRVVGDWVMPCDGAARVIRRLGLVSGLEFSRVRLRATPCAS